MNKEKGKLSLEAQKRELLLLHHTNSGCTGREAGFILVLVRGCEQRIYPQLLSDRSKHREFFTVCATRWLIHCESLVQLDMLQTVLVPVDVKNLLKNDHSYNNTGIAVRAQPAAALGQPFYPGNSRWFHSQLEDVNLLELSACFSFTEKRENVMHVLPLHGGHLGFFEGSVLFPEPLTWMDKLVVQYANAICQWEKTKPHCSDTEQAVSGQE